MEPDSNFWERKKPKKSNFLLFFFIFDTFLKSPELGTATMRISIIFCVFWTRFHPERRSAALFYVGSKVDLSWGEHPLMDDVFQIFSYFSEVHSTRDCYCENLHEIPRLLDKVSSKTKVCSPFLYHVKGRRYKNCKVPCHV